MAQLGRGWPLAAREALARACHCENYAGLLNRLAEARHGVAASWTALFGERLEID